MEIPKIIHYCWFGRNPLPESAIKCINSWKKYMPDYEIKEWNEDNFDVNIIPYTKEAYEQKKYAFVSDYARFYIMYNYGGVYFDTDVELLKPLNPILDKGPFMGCERDGQAEDGTGKEEWQIAVAPGLGIAAIPKMNIYKQLLDMYEGKHFVINGENVCITIVDYTTELLKRVGLKDISDIQYIEGTYIYPKEYFCPKEMNTNILNITENTYSIHHYDASWADELDKLSGVRAVKLKKIFGNTFGNAINVIIYGYQKYGIIGSIKRIVFKRRNK